MTRHTRSRRFPWLIVLAVLAVLGVGQALVRGNYDFRGQVSEPPKAIPYLTYEQQMLSLQLRQAIALEEIAKNGRMVPLLPEVR